MRSIRMFLWMTLWGCGCFCALSQNLPGARQTISTAISPEVSAAFNDLAGRAGVIFAGQVVSIRQRPGVVEIRFRVDVAVRGCDVSGGYVLREWSGLWASEQERYRVGQRLLMLLPVATAGGLSAPVGGMDGAIPLIATAQPPLGGASTGAEARELEDALAPDLRWIQARAVRTVPAPPTGKTIVQVWAGPVVPFSAGTGLNVVTAMPSLRTMLALQRAAGGNLATH